jgi:murein DD-endopeptidase MepM/ murein hydrolase activator NlpD
MRTRATALVVLMLAATAAAAQTPDVRAAGKPKQGPQTRWRFPVKGEHDYGNPDNNGFGVKRPDGSRHSGQDVIADCGQPLVATHRAKVEARGYAQGIGHYVVLDGIGTKLSFFYAHMKGPGGPRKGHKVKVGRRIGYVGRTEVSTGICHLHFELWKGPWFDGGHRINPIRYLRRWDSFTKGDEVDEADLDGALRLGRPS